ncbi:MAG: hypothetical protein NZ901_05890 [Geminocystis sp.]|nr:hypothetical protein [Geminocystis sp.]HIK38365.1 hypothetical protein [Geminocystis sp. M7585_C2015_104]MCS7147708.1 hypothetical protein [Geminocystis sp.]MCX8079271.1 hypothetical protein [Geminocystis sp.]MDW8116717.1 hypothetical protein [Geminocystis sp.]
MLVASISCQNNSYQPPKWVIQTMWWLPDVLSLLPSAINILVALIVMPLSPGIGVSFVVIGYCH